MSLAPAIDISAHSRHRPQLCKDIAERGYCSYGIQCTFYHPTPPTPTTASTLDLDPFNPTNDDPISPIYPSKRVPPRRSKWPSSPLSYSKFGRADDGDGYGEWRDQRGEFDVRVVGEDTVGGSRRMGSSYRTVPCKNFVAGYCPRGNLCTFKHEETSQQPSSPSHIVLDFSSLSLDPPLPISNGQSHESPSSTTTTKPYKTLPCRFHLPPDRSCPKGDACTFLHATPTTLDPQTRSPVKEVVGKQGVRIQINGLTNGVATNGGVLVGPPPRGDLRKEGRGARPSSHPLYKTRQCKYWSPNGSGTCTKGDACAFLHGTPDANGARPALSSTGGGEGREEGKHPLWRTEPCLYYQQNKCSRGDECNFLHVLAPALLPTAQHHPSTSSHPPVRPLGRKACLYLLKSGSCRFGDNCRYRHDLLPVDWAAFEASTPISSALPPSAGSSSSAAPTAAFRSETDEAAQERARRAFEDDEGEVEIVMDDYTHSSSSPSPPSRTGAGLGSPAPSSSRPKTPRTPEPFLGVQGLGGKRRTRSMSEVDSPQTKA